MEPTGIEPVSVLGINLPIVHRFSLSNPRGGNRYLSLAVGFSGVVFASPSTGDKVLAHPLGFYPQSLTESN